MTDSEDELIPNNVHSYRNEGPTIHAKGPNFTNVSSFSCRNNFSISTMHILPRNFERRDMNYDQRSLYYKRDTSPMSVRSVQSLRPRNFPHPYNRGGFAYQRSVFNGRSSPTSMRSIDTTTSISARDIALAFKNENFNKLQETKTISPNIASKKIVVNGAKEFSKKNSKITLKSFWDTDLESDQDYYEKLPCNSNNSMVYNKENTSIDNNKNSKKFQSHKPDHMPIVANVTRIRKKSQKGNDIKSTSVPERLNKTDKRNKRNTSPVSKENNFNDKRTETKFK
ncbi:unnamed protein product, partial [Iphiclides podalirius]